MTLKTTIILNNIIQHNIIRIIPIAGWLSLLKHSVNKARLFSLLIIVIFSFKINAQCNINGTTVNSSTITCSTLSGCTIVYVGDGVNPTTIVMNNNLNLSCLGAIQFIIRNNANIDFSNGNYNLEFAVNSSIIVESGGNISASSNCSASDLIKIGGVKIASCNGEGGQGIISFPNLVVNGGFNTVKATSTIICGSGTATITAVKNPTPSSTTTYRLFSEATGGTAIETIETSSSPYEATFTTPSLTSTTNYYIDATTGGTTTPRRQVTVTVVPIPSITGTTTALRCGTGTVTLGATASAGIINWYAALTGGSSLGTGTSFTTPSISASTTFYVDATNNGCTSESRTAVVATINSTNTWNGSVSTDWNNPANWSCGVPNSNSTILIPSGLTNYPLINTDGISINNIEIQNGALLNVLDNGLTITGTLTLNGKIDLQNESQLVQTSTSTVVSDCTSGKIEIDQQGSSDSYSYNYWGSPVNTDCGVTKNNISAFLKDGSIPADIKNINFGSAHTYADVEITPTQTGPAIKLSTYWMYKFANKAAGDYNSWTHIGNTGQLLAGEGFTLKGSNTDFQYQNYTFVGKPNNGLIELTVNQGMQYLIGNPYPSAIDADEFIKDNIQQYIDVNNNTYSGRRTENIIDGNLYFWDHNGFSTHLLKSYQGGYAIYNLSGEVAFQRSGIPAPPGSKTPRQFIPVAQGFFVNGLNNSGKIQFKNSQRIYQKEGIGTSEFIRTTGKNSVEKQSSEKDLTKRIYLKFNSPSGFQRQILTAFIPNTTEGIDIGYDAINNENFPEDISWVNVESTKMIIQAVPSIENKILPLEIKVASNGISKISIDQIDNISAETDILLKDNFSGLVYNLRTTAFEINLNPGTYTNRFELVLQAQKSNEINDVYFDDSSINIYLNNAENTVDIHKNNTEIKEINLYNMLGQQLQSVKKGFDNQIVKIPFNVQSGVYIVNVKTENVTVSKKIIKL